MFAPGAVAIQSEIFHFFGHKRDAGMGHIQTTQCTLTPM